MAQHILVIDDDENIVEYLVNVLTARGYEADGATGREQALRLAKENPPDLVTLDMEMPGEEGALLYRDLAALPGMEHIPFVLMCGLQGIHHAVPNAVATVNKPFDPDKLAGIIRSATKV
ncbi:response regulator [Desulfovibrio psychrotolerans]|uniref:Response regulator n=1 Tax=Desulfovibrio psychrotolerans TaxID=415242 RepID=A0A7J0BV07_9BACT|nr:response regulator [Desulfovibrio psychrotolerans]GFM36844.1 response regulator [Desulfovibrio psychrotolerans]